MQGVKQPARFTQCKTLEERIEHAKEFVKDKAYKIPLVVDSMSDEFMDKYACWPERFFVLEKGKLVFKTDAIPDVGHRIEDLEAYLAKRHPSVAAAGNAESKTKEAKEAKETKETKEVKETKETKEVKETKESKGADSAAKTESKEKKQAETKVKAADESNPKPQQQQGQQQAQETKTKLAASS